MTQEEKELLTRDVCARIPDHLKVNYADKVYDVLGYINNKLIIVLPFMSNMEGHPAETCKPYLRPMSSMTEEEGERLEQIAKETLGDFMFEAEEDGGAIYHMNKWKTLSPAMFNYLNSIHVDYNGLIPMGLALPSSEGMYDL